MPTKEMLADILAEHVNAATMHSCIAGLVMRFQSGESKLTLKASYFQPTETIAVQRRGKWSPVVLGCELWWLFLWNWNHTPRLADGI